MNRFYLFIVILIAQPLCIAMEKETTNIFTKLTCVENPCLGQYLTDDRMVVASQIVKNKSCCYDSKKCELISLGTEINLSIVNPKTNTLIKKIINDEFHTEKVNIHLAFHPNKHNFALSYASKIRIYKSATGEIEWDHEYGYKDTIFRAVFSSIDKAIFVAWQRYAKQFTTVCIHKYNYDIDNSSSKLINEADSPSKYLYDITLHPTEDIICGGQRKTSYNTCTNKTCFYTSDTYINLGFFSDGATN